MDHRLTATCGMARCRSTSPQVLEDECVGCNLCALVCPVPGCIPMAEVFTGRAAMSWKQLQEARGRNPHCGLEALLAGSR